jgi:hypothetical protein
MDKKHKSWLPFGSAKRGRASPPDTGSHDDTAAHGPIEAWFVRTKRHVLQSSRNLLARSTPKPAPAEQRVATLEADNARLRADNQRLADEVAALRKLVYLHRERGGT